MKLPRVIVNFKDHPLYSSGDPFYEKFCRRFEAEITMISFSKGSMRVRLYDIETGELFAKNMDTSVNCIEEGQCLDIKF